MSALIVLALCCVSAAEGVPAELPDALAQFKPLAANEKALVDAVREFDRQQNVFAELELKEAKERAKTGDKDGAQAKQKAAKDRYQLLRTAYEFVLSKYPKDARAQTYYGEVLYDRFGELPGALRAWDLAILSDPKLSAPYNDLGIHYCHVGEYAKGLDYYDNAIKLDSDNPDYLFNLAQTYLTAFPEVQKFRKWDKAKVYKEAMKLSKKATRLNGKDFDLARDYALNFFTAEEFGVRADWKEAAKAWEAARALARNDEEKFNGWLYEARVWIQARDKAKAATALEEALKFRPDSDVAKGLLATLDERIAGPGKAGASVKKRPPDR